MSPENPTCREIEADLVAVAAGEAGASAARGVERHVAVCRGCRGELERYRGLEGMGADLRSRMISYGIFSSPLGKILIARSELGVSLVRYLESDAAGRSYLARMAGGEVLEDRGAVEGTYRELLDYLNARGTPLSWPLDLRWAGSDFQRRMLAPTAELPYGAVTSYAGIGRARAIGQLGRGREHA